MNVEQLGSIKAIHGDCMEYMESLPDKAFDLAIVDLPYGIGADKPSIKPHSVKQNNGKNLQVSNSCYEHKDWDVLVGSDYFVELYRVSRHQVIFGANYYGIINGGVLVWDKLNGDSDQFGCEIASVSLNKRTDIIYYMWSGMMQGKAPSTRLDIATYKKGISQKIKREYTPQKNQLSFTSGSYLTTLNKAIRY